VFNALRTDQLLIGIGSVLRAAADRGAALEDYERSQLLSAYSVARLLAAENVAAPAMLAWIKGELGPVLGDQEAQMAEAASSIAVGEQLSLLFEQMPVDDPRRPKVHCILREMADREVAALAEIPE
jgi:hypothetical protein